MGRTERLRARKKAAHKKAENARKQQKEWAERVRDAKDENKPQDVVHHRKVRRRFWDRVLDQARRLVDKLQAAIKKSKKPKYGSSPGHPDWGGSRQVTEEVIRIVGGRAPVTSRKRTSTLGNPSSDHYTGNTTADAVDFGIGNAHSLADEIGRRLGIGNITDYASYYISRNGLRFRVQIIASTHGTGPHLHVGVRRA